MAYQSVHTGPEVDAAASLLDDIQEIRDESNANKDTVVDLAAQVATDANRTEAAAVAVDGVVAAAESARDLAQEAQMSASQHAADADSARALAVVARNGAEAAEAGIAQHAADAQAAATTASQHAGNAAGSEAAAATSASTATSAKTAAEAARDAAQGSAVSANADAGRAETAAASVDGVVSAAESARDAAQGFRNESEGFRDEAAQSATDAAAVAAGNVFDDAQTRADRGWTSQKIAQEIASAAPEIPIATPSQDGLMSGGDKGKLDGIATGATANATNEQLRDRSTHTGTQAASTITGLAAVATSGAYGDLAGKPSIPTTPGDIGAAAGIVFDPHHEGGAGRIYFRLCTMDGIQWSSGASFSAIISGIGDIGNANRGTCILHATERGGEATIRAYQYNFENVREPAQFFLRQISTHVWEVWAMFAKWNGAHYLIPMAYQNTVINLDGKTTVAPTDLTDEGVHQHDVWHSGKEVVSTAPPSGGVDGDAWDVVQ